MDTVARGNDIVVDIGRIVCALILVYNAALKCSLLKRWFDSGCFDCFFLSLPLDDNVGHAGAELNEGIQRVWHYLQQLDVLTEKLHWERSYCS